MIPSLTMHLLAYCYSSATITVAPLNVYLVSTGHTLGMHTRAGRKMQRIPAAQDAAHACSTRCRACLQHKMPRMPAALCSMQSNHPSKDVSFLMILPWHRLFMETSFYGLMVVCVTMESSVYGTMLASGQVCVSSYSHRCGHSVYRDIELVLGMVKSIHV
jgi:hypothetical protein